MADRMATGTGEGATAVLIAGPTASGKSALAARIAAERGGTVINADAMQVYRELRILTARPTPAEEAAVPHRLYGHVPAAERYSVGRWLRDLQPVLAEARAAGRLPVIVGGTGLYFKALTEGLAAVPEIPAAIRAELEERLDGERPDALHAELTRRDPDAAVRPGDTARILRALEVVLATGRPLSAWQRDPMVAPLVPLASAEAHLLLPERGALYRRIEARVDRMLAEGALAEAAALGRLGLPPDLPAMKAIGVGQLLDHLAGRIGLEEAVAAIKTETRRYAKRQTTWLRHQMGGWRLQADFG